MVSLLGTKIHEKKVQELEIHLSPTRQTNKTSPQSDSLRGLTVIKQGKIIIRRKIIYYCSVNRIEKKSTMLKSTKIKRC